MGSRFREESSLLKKKILVASTFSSEMFRASMDKINLFEAIDILAYNQMMQQLLDPSSDFYQNDDGANVLLVRFSDFERQGKKEEAITKKTIDEFYRAMQKIQTINKTPIFICFCPDASTSESEKHREELLSRIENIQGCYVVPDIFLEAYFREEFFDPESERIAHIPYTSLGFDAIALSVARAVFSYFRKPYKVLVVDCDNTLWGGVCAEVGFSGVKISLEQQCLHEMLLYQVRAGVLLCICSKNKEEDVFAVFDNRSDLLVRREYITSFKINWESKADNLSSIAKELNLNLDSFIFIDDNPVECAEVQAAFPEVLTLHFPNRSGKIRSFLKGMWGFDHIRKKDESQNRTLQYKENSLREEARKSYESLHDFLKGLNLKINIHRTHKKEISRVFDIFYRVNQFNFSGNRLQESEIRGLSVNGSQLYSVSVSDRFGDYGLVGAFVFNRRNTILEVPEFLLSCRVLGRGVEHKIFAWIARDAKKNRLEKIHFAYGKSTKNEPVFLFLNSIEHGVKKSNFYEFKPVDLVQLEINEKASQLLPKTSRSVVTKVASDESRVLENEFIVKMTDEFLNSMRAKDFAGISGNAVVDAFDFATINKKNFEIWLSALKRKRIDPTEIFFSMGGNSIGVVQIISSVFREFKVRIPISVFYRNPTLSAMSHFIYSKISARVSKEREKKIYFRYGKMYPLHPRQESLWALSKIFPSDFTYNMPLAVLLEGKINIRALRYAFESVIEKYGVFRTSFCYHEGMPFQFIEKNVPFDMKCISAASYSDSEIQSIILEEEWQPFDLEKPPLLRVKLLKISPIRNILLMTMHHIIFDGWSYAAINKDLESFYFKYSGSNKKIQSRKIRSFSMVEQGIRYRELYKSGGFSAQSEFWKQYIQGIPPIDLTKVQTGLEKINSAGKYLAIEIDAALETGLKEFSKRNHISQFSFFAAVFSILLSKYSEQRDFFIGTVTSGREYADLSCEAGYLTNTLLLRISIRDNQRVMDFLDQVKQGLIDIFSNQDIPFNEMIKNLNDGGKHLYKTPIQVAVIYQNFPDIKLNLRGIKTSFYKKRYDIARFDLIAEFEEINNRVSGGFYYNTSLYSMEFIKKISGEIVLFAKAVLQMDADLLLGELQNDILKLPLPLVSEARFESYNELIKLPNGTEVFYLNLSEVEFLYKEIFVTGEYEKHGISISDNDVILDVGANIGMFSLWANQKAKNLKFFCFEPIPQIFYALEKNLKKYNVNARMLCCALGGENKKSIFKFYKDASVLSGEKQHFFGKEKAVKQYLLNEASLDQGRTNDFEEGIWDDLLEERLTSEEIQCEVKRLSTIIQTEKIKKIDLLKIDVEGAEISVLAGLSPSNWSIVKAVVVELHEKDKNLTRAISMLKRAGFRNVFIDQMGSLSGSDICVIYARDNKKLKQ